MNRITLKLKSQTEGSYVGIKSQRKKYCYPCTSFILKNFSRLEIDGKCLWSGLEKNDETETPDPNPGLTNKIVSVKLSG